MESKTIHPISSSAHQTFEFVWNLNDSTKVKFADFFEDYEWELEYEEKEGSLDSMIITPMSCTPVPEQSIVVNYTGRTNNITATYKFRAIDTGCSHKFILAHNTFVHTDTETAHTMYFTSSVGLLEPEARIHCVISVTSISDVDLVSFQKLSLDLGRLYKNEDSSDLTIVNGFREYKAHKVVLTARSPIFSAMFSSDMLETNSNRLKIEDVDEEVLNNFIEYLYMGKCENLRKFARELLIVADKYCVDSLIRVCKKLLGSATQEVDILQLLERHRYPSSSPYMS